MVKVVGTSKIDVNMVALEQLLNSILPEGSDLDLEVKMDARGNVKSTFMKVDSGKCSVYSGAVETEWDAQFTSVDKVTSAIDALIFVSVYSVKKALAGMKYDMKLSNMVNIRVEDDFVEIRELIIKLAEKYTEFAAATPQVEASKGGKTTVRSSVVVNPNVGAPLTETPKVDIPEDLDLLDSTPITVEEDIADDAAPEAEDIADDAAPEAEDIADDAAPEAEDLGLNLDEPLI